MSFKFNKEAASEKKYIDRPGVFTVTVVSATCGTCFTASSNCATTRRNAK